MSIMSKTEVDDFLATLGDMAAKTINVWDKARAEDDVYTKICMTNLLHGLTVARDALAQYVELKDM